MMQDIVLLLKVFSYKFLVAITRQLQKITRLHLTSIFLSRFSVSTVEGESKKNGIHMGASIIARPLRSSAETAERGVAGAPNAQPDTWLHDAGWRRKRSLAQLTREALPRMENYRNSKRALKRPSLGELHGDHLITEEVSQFRIIQNNIYFICITSSKNLLEVGLQIPGNNIIGWNRY